MLYSPSVTLPSYKSLLYTPASISGALWGGKKVRVVFPTRAEMAAATRIQGTAGLQSRSTRTAYPLLNFSTPNTHENVSSMRAGFF